MQKTLGSELGVYLPILSTAVMWHWLQLRHSDIHNTIKALFKDTMALGVQQGKF